MNILLTLLILGLIILIHELGHFLAAKTFKMPVSEFAIGMGPKLMTFHGKETDYSLRLVPMGGFVNIQGMEYDSVVENGFNSKKPWQRFIVLFAGVFMNFLLALVIVMAMNISGGEHKVSEESVIGNIMKGSKVENVLAVGDKILNVDNVVINKWADLSNFIQNNKKEKVEIVVLRNKKEEKKEISLTFNNERQLFLIGIEPVMEFKKYTFSEGVKAGFVTYKKLFTSVVDGLKMLVLGKVKAEEMTGPIGLVKVVGDVSKGNSTWFLVWLTALLSVNVGIFNLLPFPALDGGRIIFIILEMLGIKVSKKIEERVHFIGIIILLGLFVLITANDITKFF